jgi:hypothetical protein
MDTKSTHDKSDQKRHASEPEEYTNLPPEGLGLTGGPATEAVPHGGQQLPRDLLKQRERSLVSPQPGEENDGGEAVVSGRPRERGGERPPK